MSGPHRQQIDALAARATGMVSADVAGADVEHRVIVQMLGRLVREGHLHVSRNAHDTPKPGKRACRARYFLSSGARDAYEQAHGLTPKGQPVAAPAKPAARKPASTPRRKAGAEPTWWNANRARAPGTLSTYSTAPRATVRTEYRSPTDLPFVHRPGALDHTELPSRMGNALVYRDGRRETLEG